MPRKCLVINLDRCTGCDSCIVSCKFENHLPLGTFYNRVMQVGPTGSYPNVERYNLPVQCQQCTHARCVEVCPTGASYRDSESGIVLVDESKCIGCQYCLYACPYGVRTFSEADGVARKCTLCQHLTANGSAEPACVHNCCCGARDLRTTWTIRLRGREGRGRRRRERALPVRSGRPASHDGLHPLGEDRQVAGGARRGHPLREEVAILREGCACTSP